MRVVTKHTTGSRLIVLLCAVLSACGQDQIFVSEIESTAAPQGEKEFRDKWSQLIEEARQEGEVVIVLGSTHSQGHRPIFERFTEEFGVKVVATVGSGPSNAQRVLAERSRGLFTVDISMLGSTSNERLREAGVFSHLKPLLIHPEVVDRSYGWRIQDQIWNGSEAGFVAAYALIVRLNVSEIYYNPNKVSQEELGSLNSWNDFLKPQWRGRIVSILDPDSQRGTIHLAQPWSALGREWFERFIRELEPTLLHEDSPRAVTEGLARGKYDIAFLVTLAAETDLDRMERIGLPVVKLKRTLAEGFGVSTSWSIAAFDQAAHPNAAQLFVNWYLSRDGQNTMHGLNDSMGSSVSMRSDVARGQVPVATWELVQNWDPGESRLLDTRLWKADREEVVSFIRENCRKLGCYGY